MERTCNFGPSDTLIQPCRRVTSYRKLLWHEDHPFNHFCHSGKLDPKTHDKKKLIQKNSPSHTVESGSQVPVRRVGMYDLNTCGKLWCEDGENSAPRCQPVGRELPLDDHGGAPIGMATWKYRSQNKLQRISWRLHSMCICLGRSSNMFHPGETDLCGHPVDSCRRLEKETCWSQLEPFRFRAVLEPPHKHVETWMQLDWSLGRWHFS